MERTATTIINECPPDYPIDCENGSCTIENTVATFTGVAWGVRMVNGVVGQGNWGVFYNVWHVRGGQ